MVSRETPTSSFERPSHTKKIYIYGDLLFVASLLVSSKHETSLKKVDGFERGYRRISSIEAPFLRNILRRLPCDSLSS